MSHLIHAVAHIKLNESDPKAMNRDATEILGLRVTHSSDSETWLSSNGREAGLVLLRSEENAAHTIGLETLTEETVAKCAAGSRPSDAASCRTLRA